MKVVDCRVCGDPKSSLRFAFIEFTDEGSIVIVNLFSCYLSFRSSSILGCKKRKNSMLMFLLLLADAARAALRLAGTILGYHPLRVMPSKTAIAPVNPTYLPRVRTTPIEQY